MYRLAELHKSVLVLGNNIRRQYLRRRFVTVKIVRNVFKAPPILRETFNRKIKQPPIVGFLHNTATRRENLRIFFKISFIRQPVLSMFIARPRVAEIQINPVNLALREIFAEKIRIVINKNYQERRLKIGYIY